jgi:hypothetical protein
MKSEDNPGELKGNHARCDNREGKYHEEVRPCVDEPKVPEKRQKSKQAKDRQVSYSSA